jgi:DNA-binding CsgD family transcriptional regulator
VRRYASVIMARSAFRSSHTMRRSLPKTKRPFPRYLLLFRPFALAHRPRSGWLTTVCIGILAAIFMANRLTAVRLTSLGLVPLIVAMWLLSDRQAALVGLVAVVMVVVGGFIGIVNPLTASAQLVAFVVIALLVRMYASWMGEVLIGLQQGRRSTLAAALRLAWPRDPKPAAGAESLTPRENQVADLAIQGYTMREIASTLSIGERTVESHLANVYAKLGVRSRLELVQLAPRFGLRPPPSGASTEQQVKD